MYIKFQDYTGTLQDGDVVLMSAEEFANGGKMLKDVPVAITPSGYEPVLHETDEERIAFAEELIQAALEDLV